MQIRKSKKCKIESFYIFATIQMPCAWLHVFYQMYFPQIHAQCGFQSSTKMKNGKTNVLFIPNSGSNPDNNAASIDHEGFMKYLVL